MKKLLFLACLLSMNATKLEVKATERDLSLGASNSLYIPTGSFTEVMNLAYVGCFQGLYVTNRFYIKQELCSGALVGKYEKNAFLYEANPILGTHYKNFYLGVGPSFNMTQNIYTTGLKTELLYSIPINSSRLMLGITDSIYFESKSLNMLGFSASVMLKL